jgi:hypothetical protein
MLPKFIKQALELWPLSCEQALFMISYRRTRCGAQRSGKPGAGWVLRESGEAERPSQRKLQPRVGGLQVLLARQVSIG